MRQFASVNGMATWAGGIVGLHHALSKFSAKKGKAEATRLPSRTT